MECTNCKSKNLIKKGLRKTKQRFQCVDCRKNFQNSYCYQLYNKKDDLQIKKLNAESVGIRSMSRILGYSCSAIIRRILYLESEVTKPIYNEINQVYEVDELWTFIGKNKPENYCWITYAINRKTRKVIDVVVGSRTKENLEKVIRTLKSLNPKKIITDKLSAYPNLIFPVKHDTNRYANNRIERGNLTLRTHLKRLSRKTICFSKSKAMLKACLILYLDYKYWKLKATKKVSQKSG